MLHHNTHALLETPMPQRLGNQQSLLDPDEPPAYCVEHEQGHSPFFLICDHACRSDVPSNVPLQIAGRHTQVLQFSRYEAAGSMPS